MASKSNIINILQVDVRQISLLRVRRSNAKVDVVALEQERGDWSGDEAALREALKVFAQKHELAEQSVYSVIPRYDITTRILTLPSSDPDEISSMIRLSAEEYVPFARSELVIDEAILSEMPDGSSRVLAAFAHRDGVESHIDLLRSAGIDPLQVFLSTGCLAAAVSGVPEHDRFAVANLGATGIEVMVMGPHGLEYSRAVSTVQDWSMEGPSGDEALEEFIVEVKASLSAHRRESEEGLGAEAVYVASEGAPVTSICESAAHEITVDCHPGSFGRNLAAGDDSAEVPLILLGAALCAQGRTNTALNLIPPSVQQSRKHAVVRRQMINAGALVGIIIVLLIALFVEGVVQRRMYIAELKQAIADIEPQAESTIIKQRQLRILRRQVEESADVMELLARIVELAPPETNINEFEYDIESGISIIGRVRSETLATNFAERLRSAQDEFPAFARARNPIVRTTMEHNQTVYEYIIDIPFPEEEEEAIDGGSVEASVEEQAS